MVGDTLLARETGMGLTGLSLTLQNFVHGGDLE
jgi:hypothetical protein